jgi:YHS domain-containing protein
VSLSPLGPVLLRHVVEPVMLFEITVFPAPGPTVVVDPVCRMQLSPASAVATARHRDVTYYFCAESCAAAFARRPDAYLEP